MAAEAAPMEIERKLDLSLEAIIKQNRGRGRDRSTTRNDRGGSNPGGNGSDGGRQGTGRRNRSRRARRNGQEQGVARAPISTVQAKPGKSAPKQLGKASSANAGIRAKVVQSAGNTPSSKSRAAIAVRRNALKKSGNRAPLRFTGGKGGNAITAPSQGTGRKRLNRLPQPLSVKGNGSGAPLGGFAPKYVPGILGEVPQQASQVHPPSRRRRGNQSNMPSQPVGPGGRQLSRQGRRNRRPLESLGAVANGRVQKKFAPQHAASRAPLTLHERFSQIAAAKAPIFTRDAGTFKVAGGNRDAFRGGSADGLHKKRHRGGRRMRR